MKTVAVAASSRPWAQEIVVIGLTVTDSRSSVVLGELQRKHRKRKIVDPAFGDC